MNRVTAVLVLFALGATGALAQTKTQTRPTLKETLSWMASFSDAHGIVGLNGKVTRMNTITPEKECRVIFEQEFPQATKKSEIKHATGHLFLGDLDPTSVKEETDKDYNTYMVKFERTDAENANYEDWIMGDGSEQRMHGNDGSLMFDSEESATRFARALSYAITLCGGVAAPF